MYIMYAMAIRQAIRDRRRNPASRRDQAKWRLQTLAAGWPMGYQAYSSWMYSYTDHQTTPTFVHLQATLGCTGGRRCHVTFSAGTFKPPRSTPGIASGCMFRAPWVTLYRAVIPATVFSLTIWLYTGASRKSGRKF